MLHVVVTYSLANTSRNIISFPIFIHSIELPGRRVVYRHSSHLPSWSFISKSHNSDSFVVNIHHSKFLLFISLQALVASLYRFFRSSLLRPESYMHILKAGRRMRLFSLPPKKAKEQLNLHVALIPDWIFVTFEVDPSNDKYAWIENCSRTISCEINY